MYIPNWFILDYKLLTLPSNNMNKISTVTKLLLKTFLATEIAGPMSGLENTKGNIITRWRFVNAFCGRRCIYLITKLRFSIVAAASRGKLKDKHGSYVLNGSNTTCFEEGKSNLL